MESLLTINLRNIKATRHLVIGKQDYVIVLICSRKGNMSLSLGSCSSLLILLSNNPILLRFGYFFHEVLKQEDTLRNSRIYD